MDSISPSTTRIGWIGTGVMGASMCGRLLDRGFQVAVHNRTKAKAQPLLEKNATWVDNPCAVAEVSDVVFTIVGFPNDVRETILGPDGVLAGSNEGNVIVDMTTSEPSLAEEIAKQASSLGVIALDAPVSGGDVGAREGTLSIMVGGDHDTFKCLAPCWEAMGKTIVHQGGPGAGQHTKMVNQILIAGTMVGMCEALAYGEKAGLDLEKVHQSVAGGAASSWSLTNLAPRIMADNFAPGFMIKHFLKDLDIALAEAKRLGIATPGLAVVEELYQTSQSQGLGDQGTHALYQTVKKLSKT